MCNCSSGWNFRNVNNKKSNLSFYELELRISASLAKYLQNGPFICQCRYIFQKNSGLILSQQEYIYWWSAPVVMTITPWWYSGRQHNYDTADVALNQEVCTTHCRFVVRLELPNQRLVASTAPPQWKPSNPCRAGLNRTSDLLVEKHQ